MIPPLTTESTTFTREAIGRYICIRSAMHFVPLTPEIPHPTQ